MKKEYIVDEEFLAQRGLQLSEYSLDSTYNPAIIQTGLDICITRISKLNDEVKGERAIEKFLDANPDKVLSFKKLQYRVIYNLIFMNETAPTDQYVDDVIVHELKPGRINGTQYGLFNERR